MHFIKTLNSFLIIIFKLMSKKKKLKKVFYIVLFKTVHIDKNAGIKTYAHRRAVTVKKKAHPTEPNKIRDMRLQMVSFNIPINFMKI